MSFRAVTWALDHSPYRGTGLVVHVLLGEVANEAHENELWMTQQYLARRARTTRRTVGEQLARMVADGFLTMLEDGSRAGRPNRYRFEFPDVEAVGRVRSEIAPGSEETSEGGAKKLRTRGAKKLRTDVGDLDPEVEREPDLREGALFAVPDVEPNPKPELDDFERFYRAYPRHDAKPSARQAWARAIKRADVETIVAGAERWGVAARGLPRGRKTFVPYPATWLNNDRWNDDPNEALGVTRAGGEQMSENRTPGVRRLRP